MVRLRKEKGKKRYRQLRYAVIGQAKLKEREEAIELRSQGLTYSEILEKVPVAKSTLSLWLRSVRLSKKQTQRITEKKKAAMLRGAAARRRQRIDSTERTMHKAQTEVGRLSPRELWLIGVALHWAEGSKAKEHMPSVGIIFSNSDYKMISLFKEWLLKILGVFPEDIEYSLYLHDSHRHRVSEVKKFWTSKLSLTASAIEKTYFKRDKPLTNRKNTKNEYYGLVRLRVRRSTNLNRTIVGWIEGISEGIL